MPCGDTSAASQPPNLSFKVCQSVDLGISSSSSKLSCMFQPTCSNQLYSQLAINVQPTKKSVPSSKRHVLPSTTTFPGYEASRLAAGPLPPSTNPWLAHNASSKRQTPSSTEWTTFSWRNKSSENRCCHGSCWCFNSHCHFLLIQRYQVVQTLLMTSLLHTQFQLLQPDNKRHQPAQCLHSAPCRCCCWCL